MKKIWSYVSLFLTGIIAGLIVMYKLTGEQIKVTVKKVKNKKNSGTITTTIPISVTNAERWRKKALKEERKSKRKNKRKNK